MPIYAVIENGLVKNRIVADTMQVIGFLLPDAELVIEESEATGAAHIGAEYRATKNRFVPMRPAESWLFNEKSFEWMPPTPYPADGATYYWDESSMGWVAVATIDAIGPDTQDLVAE